jgi:Protein of unknown function (DUF1631)
LVLDRYGEPVGVGLNAHPMPLDELLDYLKNIDNFSLSPWVALAAQTEAIGDPATPSREQVAVLRWLGKAIELWEKQSPLEGRVAAQVRRLKPLSAALALTDPDFLQPGVHPLHQLLDNIQSRAIGWQARLDRVGAVLEQQVTKAVEESRVWFDSPAVNLASICAEFTAAAERDQARAQRMIQRVVEAEAGKVKTAAAKQEAAKMINAALAEYLAPGEIGTFIKGPWYTSAQLLLLKFGEQSEQWRKMSATTNTLLDSFQSMEEADEARRQHIFEVVTQLPKEMRRWLLSLHHDTEAVNEAMGLVEFAHLKILRRQPLQLEKLPPIVVEGEHVSAGESQNSGLMKNWQEGQWFSVETNNDGIVRMQLSLKVEQSQQLLFTNLAGIKVLQQSFTEFDRLIKQDKVKALYSGASFSLCLAAAVGIDSVEILNALASALAESEPLPDRQPASLPKPASKAQSTPEEIAEDQSTLEAESSPEVSIEVPIEEEMDSSLEAYPLPDREEPTPESHGALLLPTQDESAADPAAPAAEAEPEPANRPPPTPTKPKSSGGFLIEQAEEIKARGGYTVPPAKAQEDDNDLSAEGHSDNNAKSDAGQDHLAEQASQIDNNRSAPLPPPVEDNAPQEFLSVQAGKLDQEPEYLTTASGSGEDGAEMPVADEPTQRRIDLPMGAWLGFHDGETPLMARLAVYDLENDYYIFVNRQGVKMRQVNRLALLKLIDDGLVDILETNSNFRDEVTEVRKNLDP